MSPQLRGVLLSLAGTALFAPVFAMGKIADTVLGITVPTLAIVALAYAGAWVSVVLAVLAMRTPPRELRSSRPGRHLLRACLGVGGSVCAVHAATVLPVAQATAIGLTDGLILVALAAWMLGERVTRTHWLAGGVCALGALVVALQPGAAAVSGMVGEAVRAGPATPVVIGVMAALAGASFIALETVYIKLLARDEPALGVLLHVTSFAVVITAGSAIATGQLTLDAVRVGWPLMLAGPVGAVAQLCFILALRQADAAVIGPINYSWVLFGALLGWFLFGETLSAATVLGALLIAGGGVRLGRLPVTARTAPDGKIQEIQAGFRE